MATYKSTAIIFRTLKYGESSLIVEAYTREKGVRSFIVNGVRSSRKSNKAALYQVMNIVDIVAYDKADNSLARIKEIKIHKLYQNLSRNIIKSSIATMMIEVARNAIKEHEANDDLYAFLEDQLTTLDLHDEDLTTYPIVFMVGLSSHLGIAPANDFSEHTNQFDLTEGSFIPFDTSRTACMTTEVSQYFSHVMKDPSTKIPKSVRVNMLNQLVLYYQYHLPSFAPLKSMSILSTILA